ncbi:MAG: radical SAM protein [Pseudonocardiaceae bacterium]
MDELRRPVEDIKSLHVILTLRCNYRCSFCFQPNFRDDLPEHIWREKLVPLYPGLEEVVLHGGEPTLVPVFREFSELICEQNDRVQFSIFTNGYRFDDYWSALMAERGRFVNFSLNAATPATYATVNRRDHYHAVLDNVRRFRALTLDRGGDVTVDFSFVIIGENLHEVPDFLSLAAEYGVDRVRYFFDLDRLPPERAEIRRTLDATAEIRRELPGLTVWGLEVFEGRVFGTPVASRYLESHGCRRTFDNLYVGVNGEASFCNFLGWSPIGNLNDSGLEEIWNSTKALAQRKAQDRGEWEFCTNAYCGPTEEHPVLGARMGAGLPAAAGDKVLVPVEALLPRRPGG